MIGQRFGRLVVQRLERRDSRNYWECLCDCGNTKTIRERHLVQGDSRSCGCLRRDLARQRATRHGQSPKGNVSLLYMRWQTMIARCSYPSHARYANYGGRGIRVCERWRTSFENFYADMGDPGPNMTLDRIDNNGDYTPENCRWATLLEQGQNKTSTRLITYQGITQSLAAWERALGFAKLILWKRLKRGWSIEKAFTTPVRKQRRSPNA